MKGRAQRLEPLTRLAATPVCKPSREGEVSLHHSMTGQETTRWFKQLRRLQSLKHAVLAGKDTPSAVAYRSELWTAILNASGFVPNFRRWWRDKECLLDDSVIDLPQGPPAEGAVACLLYEEFHEHFRRFERWHINQRTTCLKAKYEGNNYVHDLRKKAVKCLKLNGAGSNPLLRLTLSDDMYNDPGFYQLALGVRTMRRLLLKSPDLLPMWRIRMQGFSGKLLPGPFSRLIHCLSSIGWRIEDPPFLVDREERRLDLLMVDDATLQAALKDAWLQTVSARLERKTMTDLVGLDGYLTLLDTQKMQPLHRMLLSALQSGAFVSNAEHSKFDSRKAAVCSLCGCCDDRAHWIQCPRFASMRSWTPEWTDELLHLPDCAKHHLLVPRLPIAVEWRRELWALEDPSHSLAAWAVLNATTAGEVASGHLVGIVQSISRAELTALLVAVRWAVLRRVAVCIWSDSQSTVRVAKMLMRVGYIPDRLRNRDLWQLFLDEVSQSGDLDIWIRWVPSHLNPTLAEDVFEDWIIAWNSKVDELAALANRSRTPAFWDLYQRYADQLDWWSERVRMLRSFFFAIAEAKDNGTDVRTEAELNEQPVLVQDDDDEELSLEAVMIEDQLPVNWEVQCLQTDDKVPPRFLSQLINWLCDLEICGEHFRVLSEVELVFAMVYTPAFVFPFWQAENATWVFRSLHDLFQKPTLAHLLRIVQHSLRSANTTEKAKREQSKRCKERSCSFDEEK
eukprot:Skav215401  [mRNA]  locus=scaffold271:59153:63914:- [translate_table: standard]